MEGGCGIEDDMMDATVEKIWINQGR